MITSKLIPPSALRLALSGVEGPSRNAVVDLGRLLAAFYLGFPLFEPQRGASYPSLFLWSQLNEQEIPSGSSPMSRAELGQDLPAEYGPRTPVVLLVHYDLILEAILYCDHFSDIRSSIMLRIYADHMHGLKLSRVFYEELTTSQLMKHMELIVDGKDESTASSAFCHRYVQSMLELELFTDEDHLRKMQMFVVSQLEILFAQLPLRVDEHSLLPRPPIYCPQEWNSESVESMTCSIIHHLLQLLFISLHKTNRLYIEINRLHHALCEDSTVSLQSPSHSLLCQAFLLVLRTVYRDHFSLAIAEKRENLRTIAAKYNALIHEGDTSDEAHQLKSWVALSTDDDRQHVDKFLTFISERFPEKNDLPPLTELTRPLWREVLLREKHRPLQQNTDWLSTVITTNSKVPQVIYDRMFFIANEWTTPLTLDSSLIPVLLGLLPSDICSPSSSSPAHLCASARPLSNQSVKSMDRIFSPRVDIISMYAERGRKLMMKTDRQMIADENEEIRFLQEKLKRSKKMQREMEEQINEERSFVDSIPLLTYKSKPDTIVNPEVFKTAPLPRFHENAENTAGFINRDLLLLNNKLDQLNTHLKNLDVKNSSMNDSQGGSTEEDAREINSMSTCPTDDEEELDLNYEETAAATGPLPQIDKLDLSLLSPSVDVRRQVSSNELRNIPKSSTQQILAQPEWMRLIPIGERNSSRLPLLQYSPPKQREWKTERSTQTDAFRGMSSKTVSTTDDECNPADSGFLDGKSPRKRIEIVQQMSRQNIQELLSQM